MKNLENKVVAITGAGSGIGRELAINLAKEGCALALSDIDEEGLEQTVELIASGEQKVTSHIVDVADRTRVYKWADEVAVEHGGVDVIINNAGVPASDTIEDMSYEDFEWAFNIDFWGMVYGAKAFLPYLRKRPQGHIVILSSVNAWMPFRNNGPYNCAKAGVELFSKTLIQELSGSSINVTCVHPGGVKTNVVRNSRFRKGADPNLSHEETAEAFDKIAMTTAQGAARKIIKGIKKNKKRLLVGPDAYIIDFLSRMFPVGFNALLGRLSRPS